jgi:hypothetical protein
MANVLRLLLLGVFVVCLYVVELGAWHYLRARRLREGRGDIQAMPRALFAGYGLPWPYAAIAAVVALAPGPFGLGLTSS